MFVWGKGLGFAYPDSTFLGLSLSLSLSLSLLNNGQTNHKLTHTIPICKMEDNLNKKIKKKLILWLCEEKKRVGEKRERERGILFIILLGSLYYFIGLRVKIKIGM